MTATINIKVDQEILHFWKVSSLREDKETVTLTAEGVEYTYQKESVAEVRLIP